ncbi:MAG TPA: amidohydrolase family protein [Stellaceae bacterium]|nr:amidohydrolase family protein [Stellaceae bacterium]
MKFLSEDDLARLQPAETTTFAAPVPTQIVSSEEYFPPPQSARQKEVEARVKEMGAASAKKLGLSRRRFFETAAGMATSFVAMNQVFGPIFDVNEAEAATPEMADARADALKGQFIMDMHTHFLRDDTRLDQFLRGRAAVGKMGWNPELVGKEASQNLDDLKFANYFKELFLDSDTKIVLLTNSPSEIPQDWFLPQDQVFKTRAKVNADAGSKRMFAHFTITPGQPGWLEAIDQGIEVYKPDSWKGYTVGDNTHKETSHYPYRLDDEKLMYPAYEKFAKSGIRNVCIHKGLFAPAVEKQFPHLRPYADVSDVGKAAKDWPQLNFIVYHSGYRWVGGGTPEEGMAEWTKSGRISWVSDLAEIPQKYGVSNVYGDLGQVVAYTLVAEPRLAAAIFGTLIKGLGADHVVWGTDALWTGSPQWQIEGFRRLEIPEDMREEHGFAPLGAADGPVKSAIFGDNSARLYGYNRHAERASEDRYAAIKRRYEELGPARSNLRYGYVPKRA